MCDLELAVDGVPEHEVSLIQIFADKVKSHIDTGHKIVVPHQRVCKITAEQGSGRSEDSIEP